MSSSKIMQWFRSLYDKLMVWAEHGHAVRALCVLSAIEAIFFPIPVDPFLLAMGTAKPKKALWYGALATVFSVLGGLVGYAVGYLFWDVSQGFFFEYIFPQAKFQLVMDKFQDNAFWAIFLAGLTPIPFKVFTLAAGVAQLAAVPFIAGALLGRSMRFLLVGGLLYFAGPSVRVFIEKYFERITIATGLITVLALVLYKFLG